MRPTGSVATITVEAGDAGTAFTAFRNGSTRCSDPTRGAEVDGIGRLDTGNLIAFTVVACDNGPAGSGADVFRMLVPAAEYASGGGISEGDVAKSGTTPPTAPQVRGLGAIGTGTATLGSDWQEFDFDVTATPDGRLAYTDYSVVRDGAAGRMIVDPAADAATALGFHQPSDRCVRISGTGRVDTGELLLFYVDVCDNASPGAGFDTFTMTVPDRVAPGVPYLRSGSLSTGDIILGSDAPAAGTLDVSTTTTGSSLDPDGYTVTLDGASSGAIPINGNITYTNVSATSHTVVLSGVAPNCTVSGGTSRTVTVPSGGTGSAAFSVSCAPAAVALVFTVQPGNTPVRSTIQPPVQVTAVDAQGNAVSGYSGLVTIAIGRNGALLVAGTLSGSTSVNAVDGIATFPDLSIDQVGNGYTLRVTASGLSSAESQSFNIGL